LKRSIRFKRDGVEYLTTGKEQSTNSLFESLTLNSSQGTAQSKFLKDMDKNRTVLESYCNTTLSRLAEIAKGYISTDLGA
jgi:hypothetical protein